MRRPLRQLQGTHRVDSLPPHPSASSTMGLIWLRWRIPMTEQWDLDTLSWPINATAAVRPAQSWRVPMSKSPKLRCPASPTARDRPVEVSTQPVARTLGRGLSLLLAMACGGCVAPPLTREVVIAKDAAAPIGPYSQAIKANGLVFFSGQSGGATGSIEEQTARALDSLKAIVQAAGMSMSDIVSTTVYLKDVDDFARMNAVYAGYFKDKPPARATVQVARLPRDSLIQVSAIAAK